MASKKKKIVTGILFGVALAIFGVATWFVGREILKFASSPELFRAWVDEKGFLGKLAYMGLTVVQIVLAFIPGEPLEIAAGYAFGAVEGTVLCVIASTVGSMIVFFLVRLLGKRIVTVFFSEEKLSSLKILKTSASRDILYFIIFMIPGTPKDLLCYFAGLTDMKWWVWLIICSVGRIPSIITSTIGGDALGDKKYYLAAIVFGVTLLLSGAGLLIYKKITNKKNTAGGEAPGNGEKPEDDGSLPGDTHEDAAGSSGTAVNDG